jgi:hypothetical protein
LSGGCAIVAQTWHFCMGKLVVRTKVLQETKVLQPTTRGGCGQPLAATLTVVGANPHVARLEVAPLGTQPTGLSQQAQYDSELLSRDLLQR